jgi:hypothetical protein
MQKLREAAGGRRYKTKFGQVKIQERKKNISEKIRGKRV